MELADVLARFSCAIKNTTAVMLYIHTYIQRIKSFKCRRRIILSLERQDKKVVPHKSKIVVSIIFVWRLTILYKIVCTVRTQLN